MRPSDQLVDDVAAAIVDEAPVDWTAVDSGSEAAARPLLEQLRVLASIAAVARSERDRASASLDEGERSRARFHRGTPAAVSDLSAAAACPSDSKTVDGPVHWGHLRLVERVGRGAFGEVYRAWDTRLDREVALKLLPAGQSAGDRADSAIIHEGRLLARVRHPNVVTIYGAEQIEDRIGLWMEFVRGRTLAQILEQQKLISASESVEIGVDLCRAMAAVHGAGLLHRDIKAHNVMRDDDGRILLMDFGTGRELDDDASSDLIGTPLYLAPELLQGQRATVRSDIYSLGVLLYQLITGSYPVHAPTVREVRRAHERGERRPVRTARRDVPSRLARVIERAIDASPERRYPSADALAAALVALKPRPRIVRLAHAAGVAAAAILAAGLVGEVAGRHTGSSATPSALLSRFTGLRPVSGMNVNPAERPIIAVLPLINLSSEPDSDYFVDGLTDEIIRNLAVIEGLEVRSRTSSFAFKDKPRNLRHVGDQLGANLIVEGSVLRAGNRLRINAQLVNVAGDMPLWADRFDREVEDVFAIQDEISRAIVNNLRLTLGRGQRRYQTDVEAYELYLRANALVARRGPLNAQTAAELFEQALERDPAFAPAHAGLANAYAFMSIPGQGISFEAAYPIMRPAAATALQLDPLLAEAHAAMGWVYAYERDWANAEKAFQQSIDLNSNLTQTYTSYSISTLQPLAKYDLALRLLETALQRDPLSFDLQREIGAMQFFAGRYEEAIETLQRVVDADPGFPFARAYLARALIAAGRAADAIQLLDEGAPWLAHVYVQTGRRADAEKLVADRKGQPYPLAVLHAALGNTHRTIAALEQMAVYEPHRLGRVLISPEMAAVRNEPSVVALRKRFGLP